MFKFFHGAPYAVCIELKKLLSLCVLFWRSFVCCGCGDVRGWRGCCRGGDVWKFVWWGESGRVGCIRSRV